MNELTREQILAMPAGRELDSLVRKHVFGWSLIGDGRSKSPDGYQIRSIPNYSTDISAAWEVVEKMHEDERWTLALERDSETEEWIADFNELGLSPAGVGKTAQEAICKAALLAVMGL